MEKLKKITACMLTVVPMFFVIESSAQTSKDTVKLNKPNDAMTVNPGKTNDANAMMTDTGFISKNIMDNIMEIQLSKEGLSKGSKQVKKVASLLITDHTTMLNELRKLPSAQRSGTVASHMGSGSSMLAMAEMTIPPGSDFNATWASQMLTMHKAKMSELEKFLVITQDAGIKAIVSGALPKIKMHRDMLAQIPGAKAEAPGTVLQ